MDNKTHLDVGSDTLLNGIQKMPYAAWSQVSNSYVLFQMDKEKGQLVSVPVI